MIRRVAPQRIALAGALALALSLLLIPSAGAFIYWANERSNSIGRANLDGSGADQDFIDGAAKPCGVAVDGGYVYWANLGGDSIGRANLDGTGVNPSFVTSVNDPCGVAVDAAYVYWAAVGSDSIGRVDLNGNPGSVLQNFIAMPRNVDPCGVAVNATHLFWATQTIGGDAIGRANVNGTGVEQSFISGQNGPCGVAVDPTSVYWANFGALGNGTSIGRADLGGGNPNQFFVSGGQGPCGVAVDAGHVYSTNGHGDTIGRANLDGSGVNQDFIINANFPCGLAVDSLFAPPPNNFSFGKVRKNKRRGTAMVVVNVPVPGQIALARTNRVRRANEDAPEEGKVRVLVRARGRAHQTLTDTGRVQVRAYVTFTPDGGKHNTESKRLTLIKRR